jgi:hypothetical protein
MHLLWGFAPNISYNLDNEPFLSDAAPLTWMEFNDAYVMG